VGNLDKNPYSDAVTEGADRRAEKPPVKWLTGAEVDSWLSVVRLFSWLPWSIDQQLRRDTRSWPGSLRARSEPCG
jgi:hypothetical protein